METIRKKLNKLLVACSVAAVLLTMIFVNITIIHIFQDYMADVQNKRYERIVTYLEEEYEEKGQWSENTGIELMHEAYMSNYNLTLLDENNKVVWGMNPMDIRNKLHLENMKVEEQGVYTTNKFKLTNMDKIVGYVEVGQYTPLLMTEEDELFKLSINKSIALGGVISLVIITAASMYFSKPISAPIKNVANMSVKLSMGEFKEKSNIQTNIAEIVDLRNSMNILADKLNKQDMLRRRLISDMNHEIRTPLNVLQNNLEAMIDGVFPVTQERLVRLNDEIIRFGKLLDNLDKLKEFESESLKLNFKPINLYNLLENIYNDFLTQAENNGISLKLNKEDNDYLILGDMDKLSQVFINILNNAIKFTNESGDIFISIYKEHNKIKVEIKDTGIGIKEEDLPFIFERMYRGDKSRQQTVGSGLGLTIAKNILDVHSASIEVESKENYGSTFKITFNSIEIAWIN